MLAYLSYRLYLPVESMTSFDSRQFSWDLQPPFLPESEHGASIFEEKKSTPKITPDGTYGFWGTLLREKFSWYF